MAPTAIGMGRVPRLQQLVLNDPIPTDLDSVLGFGEVLHRIVVTVDSELSLSERAEAIMVSRWESMRRGYYSDPPLDQKRREDRIRDWMLRAGMPEPTAREELDRFLTDRYGIFLRVH
jgi:hypothetical protein